MGEFAAEFLGFIWQCRQPSLIPKMLDITKHCHKCQCFSLLKCLWLDERLFHKVYFVQEIYICILLCCKWGRLIKGWLERHLGEQDSSHEIQLSNTRTNKWHRCHKFSLWPAATQVIPNPWSALQHCASLNTHKYPTPMQGHLCSTEIQKLDFLP